MSVVDLRRAFLVPFGPRRLSAVPPRDVRSADAERAADTLARVLA